VRERNAERAPYGFWAIEVRDTGQVAGTIGLLPVPDTDDVEVFWHLHPDSMGNGYATEAAAGVIRYGHEHGIGEIIALVDETNEPSLGVARRLGMEPLGKSTDYYGKPLEVFVSRG
jgi:RimJ/RimL family protein N-acetyltransferase